MYYTYALYNQIRNKIYVGQSKNPEKRLLRHNKILPTKKGSFTSLNNGKWIIIYKEKCESRQAALIRENQLKSQKGRAFIWRIIKSKKW